MKNIDINEESLSKDLYSRLSKNYLKDVKNTIIRNALNNTNITDLAYDASKQSETNFVFSNEIKTMAVCNQERSGRCWIFAGLNVLREIVGKKLNIKNFELSQNYVALYDKLEKCNYMMTSIISLLNNDPSERVFMHVLTNGIQDGGQWDMFKNLVKKYGIVPQSVFKETFQSSNTHLLTTVLNSYIRNFAFEAKKLKESRKVKEISILKEKYLTNIYNAILNSFGVPPTKFNFEYYDIEDKYHIEKDLTPKVFFDKYIGKTIDEYVSIINSPTEDKPFNKVYTIDYLNNVIEGDPIKHLNLPMDRVKELVEKQISNNEVVWFGSDVGFYRGKEYWDDESLSLQGLFQIDTKWNKAGMLDFHASVMNHAMVITGFNKVDGVVNRYKIQNSWGSKVGTNGYFVMSDSWFDSFVYQVVILKKYLTKEELDAYNKEPIHLDPWDPMGTLAD